MKRILIFLCLILATPVHAQEDAWTYTDTEETPGQEQVLSPEERAYDLAPPEPPEDLDPFEPINRGIFWFNEAIDLVVIGPVGHIYNFVIPEALRIHIGYALRNLSEPIVFVNNILQGDLEQARVTFWRLVTNSTLGVAGLFDVSTSLGFPYKKQDFGLTLASWGFSSGPYIMLPILGPSTLRDTCGRVGDYAFDPINWWAFFDDQAFYSYTRTAAQLIDAKADSFEVMDDLRKNSLDYYATMRAWYIERRKALMLYEVSAGEGSLDTPRPDDDDD